MIQVGNLKHWVILHKILKEAQEKNDAKYDRVWKLGNFSSAEDRLGNLEIVSEIKDYGTWVGNNFNIWTL